MMQDECPEATSPLRVLNDCNRTEGCKSDAPVLAAVKVAASPTPNPLQSFLANALECPVCLDSIRPPIFQCENGHVLCTGCRARLDQCSICRVDFRTEIRCLQLEKMAEAFEYRCRYNGHGCPILLPLSSLRTHEGVCPSRPRMQCPLPNGCTWVGTSESFVSHLSSAHTRHSTIKRVSESFQNGVVAFRFALERACTPQSYWVSLYAAFGSTFFLLVRASATELHATVHEVRDGEGCCPSEARPRPIAAAVSAANAAQVGTAAARPGPRPATTGGVDATSSSGMEDGAQGQGADGAADVARGDRGAGGGTMSAPQEGVSMRNDDDGDSGADGETGGNGVAQNEGAVGETGSGATATVGGLASMSAGGRGATPAPGPGGRVGANGGSGGGGMMRRQPVFRFKYSLKAMLRDRDYGPQTFVYEGPVASLGGEGGGGLMSETCSAKELGRALYIKQSLLQRCFDDDASQTIVLLGTIAQL